MFFAAALFFGFGLTLIGLVGVGISRVLDQGVVAFLITPVVLVVLALLGGRWVWRTWMPVRQLIGAAAQVADGDYSTRVEASASPSISSVIESFNQMAARLEGADEQRRQLIMDLSHELRTPLTVIRGELEAVVDGVHEPDEAELTQLIGEVAVIERLIDDLQTLSLTASGTLTLRPELLDLGDLALEVVEVHGRLAADRGVMSAVDDSADQREVMGDPVRLREILTNLIVNAIRACDEGDRIDVTVDTTGSTAVVTVSDTGSGISPDALPHVFDRFHKGSDSSGSGLGLTITKELVAAHGGHITIDSTLGHGTTVTFTIPIG